MTTPNNHLRQITAYVVGGRAPMTVPRNRTIFFDQKYGGEDGEVDNAAKPFKDISQSPLVTEPQKDWNWYTLSLAAGEYVLPSNLNYSLIIKGNTRETTILTTTGYQNPPSPLTLVIIEGVTIRGSGLELRNLFDFRQCNVICPIRLYEPARADFYDCEIIINDPEQTQLIHYPAPQVPPDPLDTPLRFFQCKRIGLFGRELIRGSSFFNCNFEFLHTSNENAPGVIYSGFQNCNFTTVSALHAPMFQGSTFHGGHMYSVITADGNATNPNGGSGFLNCIIGSFYLDFVLTGSGSGTGRGGNCFEYCILQDVNYLVLQTGRGGADGGDGGHVFYNCYNCSNNYAEFVIGLGDGGGTTENHGKGGSIFYSDTVECSVTNFRCDSLVDGGHYSTLIHCENQNMVIDSIGLRNVVLREEGKIGYSYGENSRVSINSVVADYILVLSNEESVLFHGRLDQESKGPLKAVTAIILGLIGLATIIATIVAKDRGITIGSSSTSKKGFFRPNPRSANVGDNSLDKGLVFARIDAHGEGEKIAQGIFSNASFNRIVAPKMTMLDTRTIRSNIKSDNLQVRNTHCAEYMMAAASGQSIIDLSSSLMESIEFSPVPRRETSTKILARIKEHLDKVLEKYRGTKRGKRLEEFLLDYWVVPEQYQGSSPLRQEFFSNPVQATIFRAESGGQVNSSTTNLSNIDSSGPFTLSHASGEVLARGEIGQPRSRVRKFSSPLGQDTVPSRCRTSAVTAEGIVINIPPIPPFGRQVGNPRPFAFFQTTENGEAVNTMVTINNMTVKSPEEFNFIECDNAETTCSIYQMKNLNFQETAPTSRLMKSVNQALLNASQNNIREFLAPATEQLQKDPSSVVELEHVYVETTNVAGTGNYTHAYFTKWDGTTEE